MKHTWSDRAWKAISDVHWTLPEDATLNTRKEAIDNVYPFGEREYYPYKAWLKARRKYLARFGLVVKSRSMSPLEQAKRRSEGLFQ